MGFIRDVLKTGLGLLTRDQEEFLAKGREPIPHIPTRLQNAMRSADEDDERRKITLAQSGEERPTFGLRTTPPPLPPFPPIGHTDSRNFPPHFAPIEDMVSVMVPKRDSGLLADIIRIRMAGGTPGVVAMESKSPFERAIHYALACDSANGSSVAIDWLRLWAGGEAVAEKEMEAWENDGD